MSHVQHIREVCLGRSDERDLGDSVLTLRLNTNGLQFDALSVGPADGPFAPFSTGFLHSQRERPIAITTEAAGDGNAIGGIKVAAANGWFAARPSGTEAIYKMYAESFSGEEHLNLIEAEAQTVANQAFASAASAPMTPELQEVK